MRTYTHIYDVQKVKFQINCCLGYHYMVCTGKAKCEEVIPLISLSPLHRMWKVKERDAKANSCGLVNYYHQHHILRAWIALRSLKSFIRTATHLKKFI